MEEELILLDTPKKSFLQQQSTNLRGTLKEFERIFAIENGRKPKQADIKNNTNIAEKYKEYHRIQDVLAGRLSFEKLNSIPEASVKTRRHTRTDSGVGSSPQKQNHIVYATPKKLKRSHKADLIEQETRSPDLCLVNTIGPTPHRDGKILGLFDLMSNSESIERTAGTPSSSARKRKIEELYENTPEKRPPLQAIQTPSHRSPSKRKGDILEFLTGTPQQCPGSSKKKHSRTPQSEGRKFELSQFFATPSTQRFLFSTQKPAQEQAASLARKFDKTPHRQPDITGLNVTPSYLRRSTSFKDRLLSASQAPATSNAVTSLKKAGPPTLQHFRSSTSNILKATEERQSEPAHNNDEFDDDLEALREFEDEIHEKHVLVRDSQMDMAPIARSEEEQGPLVREFKKKGQKRTTRRANIKPVAQGSIAQPKFVAPDGFETDEETEDIHSEVGPSKARHNEDYEHCSDSDSTDCNYDDTSDKAMKKSKVSKASGEQGAASKAKKKAGTINPNAQSHMNFRSLKIKNKNSKAKGVGRNRFGRGRRQ